MSHAFFYNTRRHSTLSTVLSWTEIPENSLNFLLTVLGTTSLEKSFTSSLFFPTNFCNIELPHGYLKITFPSTGLQRNGIFVVVNSYNIQQKPKKMITFTLVEFILNIFFNIVLRYVIFGIYVLIEFSNFYHLAFLGIDFSDIRRFHQMLENFMTE